MLKRNGLVIKSVESVLRPEESLWWVQIGVSVTLRSDLFSDTDGIVF